MKHGIFSNFKSHDPFTPALLKRNFTEYMGDQTPFHVVGFAIIQDGIFYHFQISLDWRNGCYCASHF